jgi:putative two-component system response regulator
MRKIIIVDDEPMITNTLSTLIELMLDYEVYTFNSPADVLSSAIVKDEHIDLIISDFIMPGMNGLELLSALKTLQPHIVTILLTGYSDKESAIRSINELELYYYLEKPWDNNELIKIIQNGIEKAALETALNQKITVIEKKNQEISRLYELLRRDFNREMDNVLELVLSLSNVIEAKDSYTDGHTRRVADLAIALAKRLQLNDTQIHNIEIGAIIHDIGKVATPEAILNKPGKLTYDEFEIMKEHSEAGANIIMPITNLKDCVPIVRSHHEKLDGTGYPYGIKGDAINIETRIVAISDIFDALYTDRPYRKALPFETVKAILDQDANNGKLDLTIIKTLYDLHREGIIDAIYHGSDDIYRS